MLPLQDQQPPTVHWIRPIEGDLQPVGFAVACASHRRLGAVEIVMEASEVTRSMLRKRTMATVAATIALSATATMAPTAAFAASADQQGVNIVTSVDLGPAPAGVPDNPAIPTQAVFPSDAALLVVTSKAGNPYGCVGSTDYPHQSAGEASTHARTRCQVNVPYVRVDTSLYRGRWYGAQHLDDDSSVRDNFSYTSYDAVVRWNCYRAGTYTYEAVSAHEVKDGAQTYTARTSNSNRFTC